MAIVFNQTEWEAWARNASPAQLDAVLEVIQKGVDLPEWKILLLEVRNRLHVASVEGTLKVRSVTGTDKHERL